MFIGFIVNPHREKEEKFIDIYCFTKHTKLEILLNHLQESSRSTVVGH